jgi:succinyl-CoA synthetase beta subunit
LYFSFLVDRAHERIVMVGSAEGGMEIEDLAENNPDASKAINSPLLVTTSGFISSILPSSSRMAQ